MKLKQNMEKMAGHHGVKFSPVAFNRVAHAPLVVFGIACGLLANVTMAAAAQSDAKPVLNQPSQRYTDQRIAADLRQYEMMQERIRQLNATGKHPINEYNMAKAQCWLNVSRHEYDRNDRSAFPQDALDQSVIIVDYIEKNVENQELALHTETPLVNQAAKLREDLWRKIEQLKQAPGFHCSMAQLACAEVELVHAGNEYQQQQWRHARPYVAIVEAKLEEAVQLNTSCIPKLTATTNKPTTVEAQPPALEQAAGMSTITKLANLRDVNKLESFNLSGDTLFRFNRGDLSGLLPKGRTALDQLVTKLKIQYQKIERIQVTGFTDHFGSASYNEALSRRRAETVALYLDQHGVATAISAEGKGAQYPVKQCSSKLTPYALVECLQPNRRVEVVVVGTKK